MGGGHGEMQMVMFVDEVCSPPTSGKYTTTDSRIDRCCLDKMLGAVVHISATCPGEGKSSTYRK